MATEPNIKLEVLQGGVGSADAVTVADNDSDPAIGQTAGQILSREREKQGLEQLDICDRLRLQHWVVEALESDEYHRLAAPTYARGYLCNYANLLELPEAQVLAAYDLVRADKPASTANAKRMVSGSESRPAGSDGPSKWAPMVGLGLLFGIVGLFAAWWFGDRGALNGSGVSTYAETADIDVSDAPITNSYIDELVPAFDEPGDDDFANGVAESGGAASALQQDLGQSADPLVADNSAANSMFANDVVGEELGQDASTGISDLDAEMLAAAKAEAAFEAQQLGAEVTSVAVQSPVRQAALAPERSVGQASTVDEVPLARTYAVTEPVGSNVSSGSVAARNSEAASRYAATVNDGKTAISLYFQQDSWAEVRDANGSKLIYRLGQAGTSADVRGFPPFRVFLGNSPGVEVQLNSSPYDTSQHHRPNNTARFQIGADS